MTTALVADLMHKEISAAGESFEVNLTNTGSERLSFKVKCSNNNFYKFKPVSGIVGVAQTRKLEVIRSYGPISFDKIAVTFLPAPIGVYDPLEPFKNTEVKPDAVNILVSAVEKRIEAPTSAEVANQHSYVETLR
ncbi:hypothetical protein QR680_006377 [Steinernema hermaphroditum]|uniref:Major sperm protein n=1 Tax=Steinernema hermaphroditum TaxID=289476 RepID=A0AA39HXG5_9BILA|nr:hypothetical protein QR680_006377 [Steinernema hermaphroditum]